MTRTLTSSDFYEYIFIQNHYNSDGKLNKKQYKFKTDKSKLTYIVWIEFFPNDFISVKFHLKIQYGYSYRYNVMTNRFEARKIILTTLKIVVDFLFNNPRHSICIIGANIVRKQRKINPNSKRWEDLLVYEQMYNTKRFLRYKSIISTFIDLNNFIVFEDVEHSVFMLITKEQYAKNDNILEDINQYFVENYDNIFEVHSEELLHE